MEIEDDLTVMAGFCRENPDFPKVFLPCVGIAGRFQSGLDYFHHKGMFFDDYLVHYF